MGNRRNAGILLALTTVLTVVLVLIATGGAWPGWPQASRAGTALSYQLQATGGLRLASTRSAPSRSAARTLAGAAPISDPTSIYEQKGFSGLRSMLVEAPSEAVDPYTGNLVIHHTDLRLPGVAGMDLVLQRVYNSKIHNRYAALAGRPRLPNDVLLDFASPVGLGWTMHLGRLVGAVAGPLPNSYLQSPRYYERSDGSHHLFFSYSGTDCGNGTTDTCLLSKERDNLYRAETDGPWRLATADGLNITFGHAAGYAFAYPTEIRDVHGNRIEIHYHDDTIPDYPFRREYFRHFVDYIIDSAGRRVDFHYALADAQSDVVQLTSITAVGRTYRYFYASDNPLAGLTGDGAQPTPALLASVQPPEGAPWQYHYQGLADDACADGSRRWCELTRITYPTGGTIEYQYGEHTFWTHNSPALVRAVARRTVGGREVVPASWIYRYNRDPDAGDDHTVVERPDGSAEVYTFFGVGAAAYDPTGNAWKAGALLRKVVRDRSGEAVQAEDFVWERGPALSQESWGDPWIGFDSGVYVPRLREHTITRGSLTWGTLNTAFNEHNDAPRCTTETSSDGRSRSRLHVERFFSVRQDPLLFQFRRLVELELLSYRPIDGAICTGPGTVTWQAEDEWEQRVYDDATGLLATRVVNGMRTDYRYDGRGQLHAEIQYQDRAGDGTPTGGVCTTYEGYQAGVAARIRYGAAAPACAAHISTRTREVNPDGTIKSETDGLGHTTTFVYDRLGRLREIQPRQGAEAPVTIAYDGSSTNGVPGRFNSERRVAQARYWLVSSYDGFGRKLADETSGRVRVSQRYDSLGRVVFRSLPRTGTAPPAGDTFTYDPLGRMRSVTHADQSTVEYTYGSAVDTLTRRDQQGREAIYTRRAFANPDQYLIVRVRLPGETAPLTDTHTYLVGGQLRAVRYAGQERTIDYTLSKHVSHEHNPESGHIYYGYDAGGRLRCRDRRSAANCSDDNWNSRRAEVRYAVDPLDQVTRIDYQSAATPGVSFSYDAAGNLVHLQDGVGLHEYRYTPTNRLREQISVINAIRYETTYSYDQNGNLETLRYPSGRSITYEYDAGNRLSGVRGENGARIADLTYHPDDTPAEVQYGNGVATARHLDTLQRLEELSVPGVLDLAFDYSPAGNIERVTDHGRPDHSMVLTYDALDRLQQADGAWGVLRYDYSPGGDRTSETLNGLPPTTFSYDERGHLLEVAGTRSVRFDYDPFGNVRRATTGSRQDLDQFTYTFDAENRATVVERTRAVEVAGQLTMVQSRVDYSYDGHGQQARARRAGCNNDVIAHYDQHGNVIAESTWDGLILKEYIPAGRQILAEVDLRPLGVSAAAVDFGGVEIGTTGKQSVLLTNRTSEPLELTPQGPGVPFSIGLPLPIAIPATASITVPLEFSPTARGSARGDLRLCQSDGVALDLAIHGNGVASQAVIDTPRRSLGDVRFGDIITSTLIVRNTGDATLDIAAWQPSDQALAVAPATPVSIVPGDAFSFTLIFDSTKTCEGIYRGQLALDADSPGGPATVTIDATIVGLEVNTEEVMFGQRPPGESSTASVTLENRASVPLTPTLQLSGAPQFRVGDIAQGSVLPGEQISVPVTYQPTTSRWSPFGDHATITFGSAACRGSGKDRVHLIGAADPQVLVADGVGNDTPALAQPNGDVHVVGSLGTRATYVARRADGVWVDEAVPAVASGSRNATLLSGPGGRLTLVWAVASNPLDTADVHVISQRTNDAGWSVPCQSDPVERSRVVVYGLDHAGDVWRFSTTPGGGVEGRLVFSSQTGCRSGPPHSMLPRAQPVLAAASDGFGQFALISSGAGSVRTVDAARFDPVSGSTYPEVATTSEVVSTPTLAVDAGGGWHVTWAGHALPADTRLVNQALAGLRYSNRAPDGGWTQPLTLFDDACSVGAPSIAVDTSGGIHIAWFQKVRVDSVTGGCNVASYKLYYATKRPDQREWQITDVSPAGYAQFWGTSTRPVLSFQSGQLVAAWKMTTGQTSQLLFGEMEVPAALGAVGRGAPVRRG